MLPTPGQIASLVLTEVSSTGPQRLSHVLMDNVLAQGREEFNRKLEKRSKYRRGVSRAKRRRELRSHLFEGPLCHCALTTTDTAVIRKSSPWLMASGVENEKREYQKELGTRRVISLSWGFRMYDKGLV